MLAENIVEKWARCKKSAAFGTLGGDEAGYALHEEGFNENYGCLDSSVINSGLWETTGIWDNESMLLVARLHGTARYDDKTMLGVISISCGKCIYFEE